jgi:hypothetical protein
MRTGEKIIPGEDEEKKSAFFIFVIASPFNFLPGKIITKIPPKIQVSCATLKKKDL